MYMKLRRIALLLAILTIVSTLSMLGCSEGSAGDDTAAKTSAEAQDDAPKKEVATQFNEYYSTDWINAKEFGLVDDGKTPNDKRLKEYIKYYSRTPIYFPEGTYAFAETIKFPEFMFVYMDPKAELLCIAKEPLDFFITLQQGVEEYGRFEDYAHQSFIKGGTINCDFKAKVALGLHGGLHTNFYDFMIRDVLEKGIQVETSELHNGKYHFDNIYLYQSEGLEGTIGIYDNGADNTYEMCTAVNFETGVWTGGGKFTQMCCWFNKFGQKLIPNSVYAKVVGGNQAVFINPLVDTYRFGFKLESNENGSCPSVSITDMIWITNNVFYTHGQYKDNPDNNLMRDYPMQIFNVESDKCKLMVNGMYIPWREWGFSFSNIPLPSSSFLNVRYEAGWDPWNHMANFRDDTAKIKELIGDLYDWSDLPSHYQWHNKGK